MPQARQQFRPGRRAACHHSRARDRRITLSPPHAVNRPPAATGTAEAVAMIPTGHGQSGGT